MRTISILFITLMMIGCARPQPVMGVSGQAPKFGDYSRAEVEALRASIAKLHYPVAEHTISKMLPRSVEPLPVAFADGMPDREKKGRAGGNLVEYWLNRDYVLRVATAYYLHEKPYSLEEWAVILTAAERNAYNRRVY